MPTRVRPELGWPFAAPHLAHMVATCIAANGAGLLERAPALVPVSPLPNTTAPGTPQPRGEDASPGELEEPVQVLPAPAD
jgi:hypothetical protein